MSDPKNDIRISLVPADKVHLFWPKAIPMIEAALNFSPGRFSSDDILRDLNRGTQTLWVIFDRKDLIAAFITKVYEVPLSRVCCIEWIGGRHMDRWFDAGVQLVERYAKDCGCKRIEAHGRKGWEKMLTRHGWGLLSVSFEKQL